MQRMNLGCGSDVKDGWTNIDAVQHGAVWVHDVMEPFPQVDTFDFILINHVLLCFKPHEVLKVLENAKMALKEGGKIHVIDMDLNRVFEAYQGGFIEDIPINEGTIDDRLCFAISGYGTRLSLYTPKRMETVLQEAGFKNIEQIYYSEYDTRPKESLAFEARK